MMKNLTQKLAIPIRNPPDSDKKTVNIGHLTFNVPSETVWLLANRIADNLASLLIDISFGIKTKIYNKIIRWKARYATKKHHMTAATIDRSKNVTNYLRNATDPKQILQFNKFKKDFIRSTVDILSKKIKSLNNSKQLTDTTIITEINTNANRRTTESAINNSQNLTINTEISARATIPRNNNRGQNLNENRRQNLLTVLI